MYLMFGEKPDENMGGSRVTHESWKWTHPTYVVETTKKPGDISVIEIDPTQRMADINRIDNKIELK